MSDKPIDWRPIKSAPRDGRWILLWDDRACAAVSGGWDPEVEAWITDVDVCDGDFLPTLWLPVPHPTVSEGVFDECGWQPIETAPRDGTPILLLRPHPITRSRDFIVSGYWFAYEHQWVSEMSAIPVRSPLYWMPLPPTPTEGGRDDND